MRTRAYKSGFTLIEMLMVVAIIAILVSMVVGITKRIDDQRKEQLCRSTIVLLGNALEQFRDFGFEYKSTDYAGLTFPLDCSDYELTGSLTYYLPRTIQNALDLYDLPTVSGGTHSTAFSGSEALYFFLSQVPDCRVTLDKIDKSLLTNKDASGNPMTITINFGTTSQTLPLTRIIDPWGTTLRYDYYPDYKYYTGSGLYKDYRDSAKKTFPVITSAGPDKQFDTADDISNVK